MKTLRSMICSQLGLHGLLYSVADGLCAATLAAITCWAVYLMIDGTMDVARLWLLFAASIAVCGAQYCFDRTSTLHKFVHGYATLGALRLSIADHFRIALLGPLRSRPASDRIRALTQDIAAIETVLGHYVGDLLRNLTVAVALFGALWVLDWAQAALVGSSALLAVLAWLAMGGAYARQSWLKTSVIVTATQQYLDYLQGIHVIRASGRTAPPLHNLESGLHRLNREGLRLEQLGGVQVALCTLLLEMGFAICVAWLAYRGLSAGTGAAVLLAAAFLTRRITDCMSQLTIFATELRHLAASAQRLAQVNDLPLMPMQSGLAAPATADVEFREVNYSDGDRTILDDMSFHAKSGQMTAIVGASGSGKSTVLDLISRFYDPQHGSVSIGGVPVRSLSQDDLYAHISCVLQEVRLFSDTIRTNIRIGRPGASDAQIEAAARAAGAHDFIMTLPQGYDTPVANDGKSLSGGQRQRIAIARALIKDAPIVLLDEATAALDPACETVVRQAFGRLAAGKTFIVVAHRLSTIVAADQILVLASGRIVERGTHQELLQRFGTYAELWKQQHVALTILAQWQQAELSSLDPSPGSHVR